MDFIRTKVSGKKHRYIDEKYNLDLTYITPRIIAMAFPGSGLKALYRNTVDDVSTFLKERHGEHFIILNLSGIKYDGKKFLGNVIDYDNWPDHHSPPIELLFSLIEKMHSFLLADPNNVIAIHCNAGKGRTGTLICCYLLFSGRFKNLNDAFDYYSLKRFDKGLGVSHASQKRYVGYFFDIITKHAIPLPRLRFITRVEITCYPFYSGSTFKPMWDINDSGKEIGKFCFKDPFKLHQDNVDKTFNVTDIPIRIPIHGDILMNFYDKGPLQTLKIGRLAFNASMLTGEVREYYFPLPEIDPYKFPIKNKVKENYGIKLYLDKLCQKCGQIQDVDSYCHKCKKELFAEIANYKHIKQFLSNYSLEKNDPHFLLYGNSTEPDDVDEVLSKRELLLTPSKDRRNKEDKDKEANCYIF